MNKIEIKSISKVIFGFILTAIGVAILPDLVSRTILGLLILAGGTVLVFMEKE